MKKRAIIIAGVLLIVSAVILTNVSKRNTEEPMHDQGCKVVVVPISNGQKNKCYSCERQMRETEIENAKRECDMWTCPHATSGVPKLGYV